MSPPNNPAPQELYRLLKESRTIAVVGLSDDPARDSHAVAEYLQAAGYRIVPVNPKVNEVLGARSYASLRDIPEPIDLVNVFRRSDAVPDLIDDAIALHAKAVWLQRGVTHPEAEAKARRAGITVVSDACLMVIHRTLFADGGAEHFTMPDPAPRSDVAPRTLVYRVGRRLYPELRRFDTHADSARALLEAQRAASIPFWGIGVCLFVLMFATSYLSDFFTMTAGFWPAVMSFALFNGSISLITVAVLWLRRRGIRRSLRQQLCDAGKPTCIPCGYDLTANESGVCPECGAPIRTTS